MGTCRPRLRAAAAQCSPGRAVQTLMSSSHHRRLHGALTWQALKGRQHEAVWLAVHADAQQLAAVADASHMHLPVPRALWHPAVARGTVLRARSGAGAGPAVGRQGSALALVAAPAIVARIAAGSACLLLVLLLLLVQLLLPFLWLLLLLLLALLAAAPCLLPAAAACGSAGAGLLGGRGRLPSCLRRAAGTTVGLGAAPGSQSLGTAQHVCSPREVGGQWLLLVLHGQCSVWGPR